MEILFIIVCLTALFHYVYESAIAPSIRFALRLELFELRDQLRSIEQEEGDNPKNREAIDTVETLICNTINRLDKITFFSQLDARRVYKENKQLDKIIERRIKLIQNSSMHIQDINKKALIIYTKGLGVNIGGWVYIALPLIYLVRLLAHSSKSIGRYKRKIEKKNYKAAYVNEVNDIGHAFT